MRQEQRQRRNGFLSARARAVRSSGPPPPGVTVIVPVIGLLFVGGLGMMFGTF